MDSEPSGADVILDSAALGVQTPVRLDDLPEGYHIIRLRKGELEGEKEITLRSNVISRVVIPLVAKQTVLVITSEPAGAQVIIDGKPQGKTPFRFREAGLGSYRVGLRSIGYLPEERVVELTETGTTDLHVVLRRYGELRVISDPSEAEIYIDGEFQGRTPDDFRLAEGQHTVTLRRAGSREYSEEVDIAVGEPFDLKVTLIPENGELTVLGLPDGSEVSLDGDLLGTAPIDRVLVPSGPHWLHYRSEGFEPLKEPLWLAIQGRQETVVTITVQEKTRWNAIWRSLVFPGIGQMYSEQSLKGVAFLGLGALCVSGTVLFHYQVNDAKDNYEIAHDRYAKEISPHAIAAARENMVSKHSLMREKVDNRHVLILSTVGIWALNCIDQVLFSSTPWKGGVQATTRLTFRGKMDQGYIGGQFALEW